MSTIQEDGPFVVVPAAETKLAQLRALYDGLKSDADEAAARLKAVTDAIKLELTQAAPDQTRVELRGGDGPALLLTYVESWRLDSKRLKTEHPETWVTYAKKSGAWTLKAAGGAA